MTRELADYYNTRPPGAVALTFDTDWAPDYALDAVLGMLRDRDLEATFFCTNASPALEAASGDRRIELALHPNFSPGSSHGNSVEEVIDHLRRAFPDAVGVRSHSLVQSSPILRALPELGIEYDCNLLLYDHPLLQCFGSFFDLVRVPYGWSDASFLHEGRGLDGAALDLTGPGLTVLDLHPMLIYLNVASTEPYQRAKAIDRDLTKAPKRAVDALVQPGRGLGTLFTELLDRIASEGIATYRLRDLVSTFRRTSSQQPERRAPFDFGVPSARP